MTLVFLDIEASSLSIGSHPIEIGCAWIEVGCVVQRASLIRRPPIWLSDWSAESAAVHGICRGALAAAEPAESVARRFALLLAGRINVSDAPEFDGQWLGPLLNLLSGIAAIRVVDFDAFVHVALSHKGQRAACASLSRAPTPHRGGDDAARLASARGSRDCIPRPTKGRGGSAPLHCSPAPGPTSRRHGRHRLTVDTTVVA